MSKNYYDAADLRKFGKITEWSEELGNKFFDYYGKVFEEGALTAREKSLIALAVAHTEQCPYCIDAYTKDGLQRGITKEQMCRDRACRHFWNSSFWTPSGKRLLYFCCEPLFKPIS